MDSACRECASVSGGLALVPGPLGFLTVLPDLYKVWRIQSQIVSDIAAVYGKAGSLTPEHMVHRSPKLVLDDESPDRMVGMSARTRGRG